MENEDRDRDHFTCPQKIGGSFQEEWDRHHSRRQLRQAGVRSKEQNVGHTPCVAPSEQDLDTGSASQTGGSFQDYWDSRLKRRQAGARSKKQNVGHIPRVAPSEQDLDTGSASQTGQTIRSTTAVAGAQRAGKKGQNPRCQPPSQTSAGFHTVSQPILPFNASTSSRSDERFRQLNDLDALANNYERDRGSAHGQESAYEGQASVARRIALAEHDVIDSYLSPPNARDERTYSRPTSLNSHYGTVLANEDDYVVREEGFHDDGEWDRCENVIDSYLSPPNERYERTCSRPTSLNSQCGTVLANEHDYLVREELFHEDGEWDRCEMSSSED